MGEELKARRGLSINLMTSVTNANSQSITNLLTQQCNTTFQAPPIKFVGERAKEKEIWRQIPFLFFRYLFFGWEGRRGLRERTRGMANRGCFSSFFIVIHYKLVNNILTRKEFNHELIILQIFVNKAWVITSLKGSLISSRSMLLSCKKISPMNQTCGRKWLFSRCRYAAHT